LASDRDPVPDADDTVTVGGDEGWPVAEQYRVVPDTGARSGSTAGTTILVEGAPAPERRRLPVGWPGVLIASVCLAAALIVLGVLLGMRAGDDEPATTAAPPARTSPAPAKPRTSRPAAVNPVLVDVAGDPLVRARARLERAGLRVRVRRIESKRPRDEVLSQAPRAGGRVASGAVVVLTVARGTVAAPKPARVSVPGVVGLSASDAVVALRDAGLQSRISLVPSSASAGTVLRQTPAAGAAASRDAVVRLDVARIRRAPKVVKVDVPNLVGASVAAARSQLRALGLVASVTRIPSEQPTGTVVRQTPRPAARLSKGATVRLEVSSGAQTVDLPDVTGLDEESARSQLEDAGFEVRIVERPTSDPAEDGVVLTERPAPGSAAQGSVVTLTVGRLG
jgi:beta-lactam-binding protein with PASTA domain